MKLVSKNGLKFVTGIFWQIPDEGKSKPNLTKLAQDTRHNLFCQIKRINPTWGFCRKEELLGEKRVASLGKFIVEASRLSAEYTNSIICFKFKSAGEVDDGGGWLESDLYGYIVLVNGTICPDEGEYVARIEMVKHSIYEQASKHDIATLYLPVEVASQFFSIFEILYDAYTDEKLLYKIIQNLSTIQMSDLKRFIRDYFAEHQSYNEFIKNKFKIDILILRQLINEPTFSDKLKSDKERDLKYLIPGIVLLSYTSDEIYWQGDSFKKNYAKSLLQPLTNTFKNYKLGLYLCVLIISGITVYKIFYYEKIAVLPKKSLSPIVLQTTLVEPIQLIKACLSKNDQYFRDLGTWSLNSIKCNSYSGVFTFISTTETTLSEFNKLLGKKDKNIHFANKVGTYTQSYTMLSIKNTKRSASRETILNNLQQAAIDYNLHLTLQVSKSPTQGTKFNISSKQSPVFLLNHHVLDNLRLKEVTMNFDKNSGYYSWVVQGEF